MYLLAVFKGSKLDWRCDLVSGQTINTRENGLRIIISSKFFLLFISSFNSPATASI